MDSRELCWKCKMLKTFWKNRLAVSPKLHIHLLNDPEIPHLVIFPSEIKSRIHPKTWMQLLWAQTEKKPKWSIKWRVDKVWYGQSVVYSIQWNTTQQPNGKLLMKETTRVHCKSVMLSERIYTQKETLYDSLYGKFWEKQNQWPKVIHGSEGLGAGRRGLTGGALGNLWE